MSGDPRLPFQPAPATTAGAPWSASWGFEPPAAHCPPAIEEWQRAARARLLRRYGGLVAPKLARFPSGR